MKELSKAEEMILPRNDTEFTFWRSQLEQVKGEAGRRGISLSYGLRHPTRRRPVCAENAAQALFVGADGSVSPCVFTNLPLKAGEESAWPSGYVHRVFGNVNKTPLRKIWGGPDYSLFRDRLTSDTPPSPCDGCAKLYTVGG